MGSHHSAQFQTGDKLKQDAEIAEFVHKSVVVDPDNGTKTVIEHAPKHSCITVYHPNGFVSVDRY